jgi:hypothetical protein
MTKNDFANYRALVLEVRQLRSLLAELEAAKFSVPGGDFSGMPRDTPSQGSAVENKVVRYLDTLALYQRKVADKTAQLIAIEAALDSLDSPVERMVMRLRYIEGRSWASVCCELEPLGYSERQVYRLHGFALMKLKED